MAASVATKRKAEAHPDSPTPKVTKLSATPDASANSQDIFPFFELPPELQDQIYDCCAEDTADVHIISTGKFKGQVTGKHPLIGIYNKQVTADFGFRLAVTTAEIFINVTDFDFTALRRYVREIEKRIANNAHFDITAGHKLIVNLSITASWPTNPDVLALEKDCKWLVQKTKPHNFNIVYRTKHVEDIYRTSLPLAGSSLSVFEDGGRTSGWDQVKWSFEKYAWEAHHRAPLELRRQRVREMEVRDANAFIVAIEYRQIRMRENNIETQLQQWASDE